MEPNEKFKLPIIQIFARFLFTYMPFARAKQTAGLKINFVDTTLYLFSIWVQIKYSQPLIFMLKCLKAFAFPRSTSIRLF